MKWNEFFFLDTSRNAEEWEFEVSGTNQLAKRRAAYNKGFALRKALLGTSSTVNTEIPLNRYSFLWNVRGWAVTQYYPGPRGFSWFFFATEIKSKPRSGDNKSQKRRGERETPLVTLASNLTFMQTTGSGSDPRALIGWYFSKHVNQFDWLV